MSNITRNVCCHSESSREWSDQSSCSTNVSCIYFAYTRRVPTVRNQRRDRDFSLVLRHKLKKRTRYCSRAPATLRYLLHWGVDDVYAPRGVVVIHWDHETPSPLPYLCIRHSWRAAAVGGLAGACRSVLFLGKVPALYQDIKDLGKPLAWGTEL